MGRGRALLKCQIAIAGRFREYPLETIRGWITNLGGSSGTSVSKTTTHVVATPKAWKRKDQAVAHALMLNDKGADIKIVSYDWLEDSVGNKSKKREGPYLWNKFDAAVAKQDAAKAREEKSEAKKSKGHVGMMAEVFQESTEQYVDPRQAKELEKQIKRDQKAKEAVEEEERQEKKARKEEERKKQAELFGQGAKKARNDIFSENHHIYADDSGFKHDIVVTKVDTRHNRNERYAITIYESNAEPHTYACNLQFAGTNHLPSNDIITAIGSPFPPAFHQFKKVFKEKTHVEWDDRIEHAFERTKNEKRDRGLATSSEDQGSRKGTAVSSQEEKAEQDRKAEQEFQNMPFQYDIPRFGPRGKLPADKQIPAELVHAPNAAVEYWMSGGNGDGPIDLTEQETEIAAGGVNEFDAMINAESIHHGSTDPRVVAEGELPSSIFDRNLTDWVGSNLDNVYPFDHTADNLEYLQQANGDGELPSTDTIDTAMTDFNDPYENGSSPQQGISFDTDATEPPISFNLPSTVPESFEPGSQDISETKIAERAQNEFLEFADLPDITDIMNTTETNGNGISTSFDLGSSILGKRKMAQVDSPIDSPINSSPGRIAKSARYNNRDEAFAFTAEESFDADQFISELAAPGAHESVPRAMFEEYDFGSTDEATGEMAVAVDDEGLDAELFGEA